MLNGCCGTPFKGAGIGMHGGPPLSVLENGFHFPDGPAFPGRYHAHLSAVADQRVRTDLVVGGHAREFGFWFPAEGEIEVAREDLPSRAVIQLDDVALGMGPDPRGAFRIVPAQWRRQVRYFCPDGACAFELLGLGLLAS